jgi:hypothetical protein
VARLADAAGLADQAARRVVGVLETADELVVLPVFDAAQAADAVGALVPEDIAAPAVGVVDAAEAVEGVVVEGGGLALAVGAADFVAGGVMAAAGQATVGAVFCVRLPRPSMV